MPGIHVRAWTGRLRRVGCSKRHGLLVCLLVGMLALAGLVAASAAASTATFPCSPTPVDGFGPFGRGEPPVRAKIGTGHVLTGVVVSAATCNPIRGAHVSLWQENANGAYTRASSATVITDRTGHFRFQGPRPPSEGGRPAHIHLRIIAADYLPLLARYELPPGSRRGSVRLVLEPDEL